ncbi:MAG: acetyl-CoA carboxylase biotin carboxyl carrier protein subunit [Chloroflexi bacterium]|nr:acetyl-CoA carboxylase biotin carboxyl carrier protein subunit [Chloroflexota bacterium]
MAVVEGEAFEVWPEEVIISHPSTHSHAVPLQAVPLQAAAPQASPAPKAAAPAAAPTSSGDNAKAVRAPIPGVIISVAVKAGDAIKHGQELCVLEAMKMKNVIRASRAGTIGVVRVAAQQHVKHHDVLMEFTNE